MPNEIIAYSDHNDAGDCFGQEALREQPRNNALHVHLRAGGSILTFRRPEPLPSFDVILSQPGILK